MDYPLLELSQQEVEIVNKFNNNSDLQFEKVSCLNCNSSNQKVLFSNDRYGINQKTVLCINCGLIFSNPRLTKSSAEFFYKSDIYRKLYGSKTDIELEKYSDRKFQTEFSLKREENLNLNKYYNQLFFDIINSLNIKYQTVCEIGAGAGWNLKPFKQIGKEVLGYEPSKFLSNISKKNNINIIRGFSDDITGEYDLVILKHVLEHFLNPVEELKKIRKHIKKYLFIEVPGCINKIPSIQNAHNFYFSLNTLKSTLNKCGFKEIYFDYSRSNDFIFALFEKANESEDFYYNNSQEIARVLKIHKKFCVKRDFKKILKKIHPNLGKIISKIYKKIF
jgi:2-polyprenyl-3-methyl-5-hydroxy-6-metoxy-1,4-benzoquinol methylase|tara:strand:+ start:12 stop:1013 length:1002 start_codon:yes stop_codon:yes gene_type:complete